MKAEREKVIKENQKNFNLFYKELPFIKPEETLKFSRERDRLVEETRNYVKWGYNRTKVDCTSLSKGCQTCGAGTWSCLFINNKCNASCFYCPTSQDEYGNPTTQTVEFEDVENYISYLRTFNFKGVSISGGEPFLSFDKSLHFIRRIRESFGENMYIWLYTNGILVTEEKLCLLKKAGLDEIRFDIGATGYNLEKVRLAKEIIPIVTVEIPAVPEDFQKLKNIVSELASLGVDHLNLHQIRCTEHNYKKLLRRNYTFLHGPKITVLESELTALKLIKYVKQNKINIPLNYCSFIYKYRFQRMAARRLFAPYVIRPYEEITETGIIRDLSIKGDKNIIKEQFERLSKNRNKDDFILLNDGKELHFKKKCWKDIDVDKFRIHVSYSKPFLLPAVSYRNIFKEISLTSKKKVVVERVPLMSDYEMQLSERELFETFFINDENNLKDYRHVDTILELHQAKCSVPDDVELIVNIYDFEKLRWGLLDYY
jgi:pyruvate formate-lyase activating enzyme-like uncharacterized protein